MRLSHPRATAALSSAVLACAALTAVAPARADDTPPTPPPCTVTFTSSPTANLGTVYQGLPPVIVFGDESTWQETLGPSYPTGDPGAATPTTFLQAEVYLTGENIDHLDSFSWPGVDGYPTSGQTTTWSPTARSEEYFAGHTYSVYAPYSHASFLDGSPACTFPESSFLAKAATSVGNVGIKRHGANVAISTSASAYNLAQFTFQPGRIPVQLWTAALGKRAHLVRAGVTGANGQITFHVRNRRRAVYFVVVPATRSLAASHASESYYG